jgi:hypothetical protein
MSGTDSNSSNPLGGANPTGSPGGATRKCTKCTITSQTAVSSPPDRARTTIGVGEEVNLTCSNSSVAWSVTGDAVLSGGGASATLQAGSTAGAVTVTATGPTCTCSIAFTVIAPSDPFMEPKPGADLKHHHGRPDCGYFGKFYLPPDTVSFKNLEVREKNSKCVADGFYKNFNNLTHQPAGQTESAWFTMNDCIAGKGTLANLDDTIYSGAPGGAGPPFEAGTETFPIVWEYRVRGGAATALKQFEHKAVVDAAGKCTMTKDGASASRVPDDPKGEPWPD